MVWWRQLGTTSFPNEYKLTMSFPSTSCITCSWLMESPNDILKLVTLQPRSPWMTPLPWVTTPVTLVGVLKSTWSHSPGSAWKYYVNNEYAVIDRLLWGEPLDVRCLDGWGAQRAPPSNLPAWAPSAWAHFDDASISSSRTFPLFTPAKQNSSAKYKYQVVKISLNVGNSPIL